MPNEFLPEFNTHYTTFVESYSSYQVNMILKSVTIN